MSTRSLLIAVIVVVSIFIVAFGVNTLYRKYSFEEEFFSQVPECTMSDVLAPVMRSYFSERNTKLLGTIVNITFDAYAIPYVKNKRTDLATLAREMEYVMNVLLENVNSGHIIELIRTANLCLNELVEQTDIQTLMTYLNSENSRDRALAQFVLCFFERFTSATEPSLDDIHQAMLTIHQNARRWLEVNYSEDSNREIGSESIVQAIYFAAIYLGFSQEEFYRGVDTLLARARESLN